MLQQTQASRVIDFFLRWMDLFPSFHVLAQAHESEVMKAWEGLGYYSRARSVHAAAKYIVEHHGGILPSTREQLLDIPGIGPYTAGAILSFAFHQRAVAVDANVRRVISRLHGKKLIDADLESFVEKILPQDTPWNTMEALIELGALVCRSSPLCHHCPLSSICASFAQGTQKTIFEKPASKAIKLFRDVAVVFKGTQVWVMKRTGKEVMSGLYEFPFFETTPHGRSLHEFSQLLTTQLACSHTHLAKLSQVMHSFTKYRVTLFPHLFAIDESECPHGEWVDFESLSSLPFSSGHRRVLFDVMSCAQNFVSSV
jgi:A/G-specific adenine glycosylase